MTQFLSIAAVAAICHQANQAYCYSQGDESQPAWSDAPDWQLESAIKGVDFHLKNPDASPSASHESWLAEKEAAGWKYGPVKNPETKEHPSIKPYADLPAQEQAKDYLFKGIVESLRPFIVWTNTANRPQVEPPQTAGA